MGPTVHARGPSSAVQPGDVVDSPGLFVQGLLATLISLPSWALLHSWATGAREVSGFRKK